MEFQVDEQAKEASSFLLKDYEFKIKYVSDHYYQTGGVVSITGSCVLGCHDCVGIYGEVRL